MSDDMAAPRTDRLPLRTSDSLDLRAELAAPVEPTAVAVVCHPHPLHGGNMFANVVETLFGALPAHGVATLRFNFRGTNGSDGRHDHGQGEQLDVVAAIETVTERHPGLPVLLAGYSFGADMALAVDHPAITGWLAVAPPLRIRPIDELAALHDPRPCHLLVAAHDQFRPPNEVADLTAERPACTAETIDGADHFFVVGLNQIAESATGFVDQLTAG